MPPSPSRGGPRAARAQLFSSALLFGLMAALARMASQGPQAFTAGQLAAVRFAGGALACLALFALRPGTFRPVRRRLLAARGLLGGIAALLYFVSLSRIPAGEATLLNSTFPLFATLMAAFALGERPTGRLLVALALATAGVGCVLGRGGGALSLGWGEAAGLGSALLGAASVICIRALRATDNAATIFFSLCLGGLAVSVPMSGGAWPAQAGAWAPALAAAAVGVGAQLLMTHALGSLTVPEASVWQQLTPVASYLWALGLLDERVSGLEAVGGALVLAGVAWGAMHGEPAAPRPVGRPTAADLPG